MNPYVLILIAVAAFASGWEVNGWRLHADFEADKAASWKTAKEDGDRRVAEVRKQEAEGRRSIAQINGDLQTNLTKREKELEKANRDLRSGFARLLGTPDCSKGGQPNALPDPAGTGRSNDGERGTELPDSFAGFFGAEAKRANGIVDKLSACQQTVTVYQKTCSQPPK